MEEIEMKRKWFLQTWFICILFALTVYVTFEPIFLIFPLLGIILVIIQAKGDKKFADGMDSYKSLVRLIDRLKPEYEEKRDRLRAEYDQQENTAKSDFENLKNQLDKERQKIQNEIQALESDVLVGHYSFSSYDGISSEECRNKLSLLKNDENALIRSGDAIIVTSTASKKEVNDNKKQILRCFNTECDNVLLNLSVGNIDSMRNKIARSFESLNKVFQVDGVCMTSKLLEYKLEELSLAYTYELKKEQERELQKEIKAQMLEEEKVRREIERQKAKIEKDQAQVSNEVN